MYTFKKGDQVRIKKTVKYGEYCSLEGYISCCQNYGGCLIKNKIYTVSFLDTKGPLEISDEYNCRCAYFGNSDLELVGRSNNKIKVSGFVKFINNIEKER